MSTLPEMERIKAVEKEAAERVSAAEAEAVQILARAGKEAARLRSNILEAARQTADKQNLALLQESATVVSNIEQQTAVEIAMLEQHAKKNREAVVKMILKKVTS